MIVVWVDQPKTEHTGVGALSSPVRSDNTAAHAVMNPGGEIIRDRPVVLDEQLRCIS